MSQDEIVVIDIETAGKKDYPDPHEDSIVEIAAIALNYRTFKYWTIISSLCNPSLPKAVLERTWVCTQGHITLSEILNAQSDTRVATTFRSVLGSRPWTSFNLEFDGGFLLRQPWSLPDNRLPCIMEAAKPICAIPHDYYEIKRPSLEEAYQKLLQRSPLMAHRALADIRMATEVLIYLIKNGHYKLN